MQHFLEHKTLAIKVNIETNRDLTAKFKVKAIPCLVFIDGDGKEVGKLLGSRTAENFLMEVGKYAK